MSRRFLVALGVLALTAGGCATMTTGTSQSIAVNSQPDEADCTLTRDGATLASIKTPTTVTVKRDSKSIHVLCRKQGYEDGMVVMTPGYEGASAGNFVLGGVVGVIIDAQSGANNRYQEKVTVALTPAVGGSSFAAVAAAVAAAAAVRAPVQAPVQAPVSAQPAPPQSTAAPAGAASPFDGTYEGDVELVQRTSGGFRRNMRHIEVTVRNGVGTGTVKHAACNQPGELSLTIDPTGQVNGTANSVNTDGCAEHKATLTGRVEGNDLKLAITRERFEGWSTDFTLARRP